MPKIVIMTGSFDNGIGESANKVSLTYYYWLRIVGKNGEIMFDSEDYSTKSNTQRAAKRFSKLTGFEVVSGN